VSRSGAMACVAAAYGGAAGIDRWVRLGVIANNLMSIATFERASASA
jgi:hypothetical protein